MVNTAVTLLILFLLSTCLIIESSAHTGKSAVNHYTQTISLNKETEYKFEKIDDHFVVDLCTKDHHKSTDLSAKSIKLTFHHALEKGSVISLRLETSDKHGPNILQARINLVLSVPQVSFTPNSIFPIQDLVHTRRLTIHAQTNINLKSVFLIDAPSDTLIKQQMFMIKVWDFYQEIKKLLDKDQSLVLDVSTPYSFKKTFWDSPIFRPKSLNMDLKLYWEKIHTFSTRFIHFKVVHEGANPKARLITLLSQDMSIIYSNILANPTYCSFMNDVNHFRYLGQMIGMAIANGLPVDMSFTRDVFLALIKQPKHTMVPHILNGFIHGPKARKRAQIVALCHGIWKIVPRKLFKRFNIDELGWLITGRPAELINVDFLKMWVKYERGMSENTPLIKWFWAYVASLNPKELIKLWEIITGSSRLASLLNVDSLYYFMIVSKSVYMTHEVSIDSVLPVGMFNKENEPALLYIPPYSSELVLQNNFNRIIKPTLPST